MNKLSIKQVCNKFQLSEVYVRRMILQGKIATEKVLIANNTYKHMIEEDEVIRWRSSTKGSGSKRSDGRNKYTLYGSKAEIESLQKLLNESKAPLPLVRSNAKKIKTT